MSTLVEWVDIAKGVKPIIPEGKYGVSVLIVQQEQDGYRYISKGTYGKDGFRIFDVDHETLVYGMVMCWDEPTHWMYVPELPEAV